MMANIINSSLQGEKTKKKTKENPEALKRLGVLVNIILPFSIDSRMRS